MGDMRTEEEVFEELSADARALLVRVLQIEKSKLHVKAADTSIVEDILSAVRGVKP